MVFTGGGSASASSGPTPRSNIWWQGNTGIDGGSAAFFSWGGFVDQLSTVGEAQCVIPFACTLANLNVHDITNSTNGTVIIRSNIEGAGGNLLITIPAATTGWFSDAVNEDTITADDLFCWYNDTAGTANAGSTDIRVINTELYIS